MVTERFETTFIFNIVLEIMKFLNRKLFVRKLVAQTDGQLVTHID